MGADEFEQLAAAVGLEVALTGPEQISGLVKSVDRAARTVTLLRLGVEHVVAFPPDESPVSYLSAPEIALQKTDEEPEP